MSETIIYMKGDAGFKPAVITKLGSTWINTAQDIDQDIVSFTLPEDVALDDFKASIGEDVVSNFHIMFFNILPVDLRPETQFKFVPGHQIKMSIWANTDSKLMGSKMMIHND